MTIPTHTMTGIQADESHLPPSPDLTMLRLVTSKVHLKALAVLGAQWVSVGLMTWPEKFGLML